ncbi:MAG: HlyD family efflux transporter periplasmic adaptor subunit [Planctomycetes bacterium]|nr:HlyD family efflux transporter periplasmic adaptor subunit [Planctomycetota bacterium]
MATTPDLADRVQQLRLDNQLGAGTTRRGGGAWLPWVLCGILAVTWAGVGVRWYKAAPGKGDDGAGAPAANQPAGNLPPSGGGAPVEAGAMVTQLKGIVIPSLQVTVSPRDVGAEITEINFAEGKRVKKGDTLATLLDAQYANRLKTEEATVKAAEAQELRAKAAETAAGAMVARSESALAAAEARVTRAAAFVERASKDFAQAKSQFAAGTIGAQEYQKFEADKKAADADKTAADADVTAALRSIDAARADVKTAAATSSAAGADVGAAKARRDEAKRLVANCVVTAPIDGTVLTKSADRGALVSPMSFNVAAGICSIADLAKLEVEIDVPERQVTKIRPGQVCKLQADADTAREYRGVVDRVMPIADDTKNVVKVRVRVYLPTGEEPGAFLKPKMSITATVYERAFALDPKGDMLWGDENERKGDWEKGWGKKK